MNGFFSSSSRTSCARRVRLRIYLSCSSRAGSVSWTSVGVCASRTNNLRCLTRGDERSCGVGTHGDPARTQIHVERTFGDVELRRNLAHTELPLAIHGLCGQGGGFPPCA